MPERLNDLEELLHLVRVNEFPTILGNRAMHEVQRLRNLAGENVRIKTRAPESLNGRPETEKYEYSRDMLKIFITEDSEGVILPVDRLYLNSWGMLAAGGWCFVLAFVEFPAIWVYQVSRWVHIRARRFSPRSDMGCVCGGYSECWRFCSIRSRRFDSVMRGQWWTHWRA